MAAESMTMLEKIVRAMGTYTVKPDNNGEPAWTYGIYEQPYEFKKPIVGGLPLLEATERCRMMNARAAVETMREPNEAMLSVPSKRQVLKSVDVVWREMIDAILNDNG